LLKKIIFSLFLKNYYPYSLDALAKALKDESALVRKEAIEGLKKIKKRTKEKELDEGKLETREPKEKESKSEETTEESNTDLF